MTHRLKIACLILSLFPWTWLQAGGCPDLEHIQGGGTVPDLIISAIDPGEWIEVFNPNPTPFDFDTSDGDLCEPFSYRRLDVSAPGIVLAPGGYARLPWPAFFSQSNEAGGQIILYNFDGAHSENDIADFVCWGSDIPGGGRKFQAEAVGKWTGGCAPAISAGMTIRRLVSTDGITSASYNTNAAPEDCSLTPGLDYQDGFEEIE
jgi:hypothetical protein